MCKILVRFATSVLLCLALSCGGGADVTETPAAPLVVTIEPFQPRTVTTRRDAGVCVFTVPQIVFTIEAPTGSHPFDDVLLDSAAFTFTWDLPSLPALNHTDGIGGTVPAGGTLDVGMEPLVAGDLTEAHGARTATFTTSIAGHTVGGTPMLGSVSEMLQVNACPP